MSVIQANQGKINAMHSYHSLGRVLRDAGFTFPPLIESIPEGGRIDVSAERLPELDADFVFATARGYGRKTAGRAGGDGCGHAGLVSVPECLPNRALRTDLA